jgi:hypothetical protein
MSELRCPVSGCEARLPSRSRLVHHVDLHNTGLTTKDVPLSYIFAEADAPDTRTVAETLPPVPEATTVIRCVCGSPLELLDANTDEPWWSHRFPSSKCRNAIPAAGLPTAWDRQNLVDALKANAERLAVASADISDLRRRLEGIDQTIARTESAINAPHMIRRAALSDVLDKLLDAGDMTGYGIVSQMLRGES